MHEVGEHAYFAVGQLGSEWRHAVAAFGDLVEDLVLGFLFEFADSQAGNDGPVIERFAFALGAVADRAVLTKE